MANPDRLIKGGLLWIWAQTETSPGETAWAPVACTTSKSFNATTEDVDLTSDCDQGAFGSSASGTRGWTMEASAFATRIMGSSDTNNWNTILRMWKSGAVHRFRIAPAPGAEPDESDEFFLEGPGRVTEFSLTGETAEYVTFDFTVTGTGEVIDEPEDEV